MRPSVIGTEKPACTVGIALRGVRAGYEAFVLHSGFPPLCEKDVIMQIKHFLLTVISLFLFAGAEIMAQTVGDATYYGNKFHGRRTSDGSRYHKDSLTCAHRTLPFGTYLKVRNPKNGQEVVVKVTDRGPFRKGAIVDLSYAAAKEIGIVQAGVARVEVMEVAAPSGENGGMGGSLLPELQLLDPVTGKYYTASEWAERGEKDRARAKVDGAKAFRTRYLSQTQKEQPRWRVLNDKMTAKAAGTKQSSGLPTLQR